MTPEEKKNNKNYILANLDKYTLDSRGSFYSLDLELTGDTRYYIGREAVNDYEELEEIMTASIIKNISKWSLSSYPEWITQEIFEKILKEINDWEIFYPFSSTRYLIDFKHRSGEKIRQSFFDWDYSYYLSGVLGYREGVWKDFEKK